MYASPILTYMSKENGVKTNILIGLTIYRSKLPTIKHSKRIRNTEILHKKTEPDINESKMHNSINAFTTLKYSNFLIFFF